MTYGYGNKIDLKPGKNTRIEFKYSSIWWMVIEDDDGTQTAITGKPNRDDMDYSKMKLLELLLLVEQTGETITIEGWRDDGIHLDDYLNSWVNYLTPPGRK